MIFTEEQIETYREIYRKKFNEEITKEFAIEKGVKLINFVRVLLNHGSKQMCEDLKYKNLPDVF